MERDSKEKSYSVGMCMPRIESEVLGEGSPNKETSPADTKNDSARKGNRVRKNHLKQKMKVSAHRKRRRNRGSWRPVEVNYTDISLNDTTLIDNLADNWIAFDVEDDGSLKVCENQGINVGNIDKKENICTKCLENNISSPLERNDAINLEGLNFETGNTIAKEGDDSNKENEASESTTIKNQITVVAEVYSDPTEVSTATHTSPSGPEDQKNVTPMPLKMPTSFKIAFMFPKTTVESVKKRASRKITPVVAIADDFIEYRRRLENEKQEKDNRKIEKKET
ncbi:hypothetical protein JTB14_007910 [Gonioctena quinquepunctata]|nr:hypothetical protein JTB14_007910 [Gonioctena quinquepunctata]